MRLPVILCAFAITADAWFLQAQERKYVPNAETAVAITEAVLIPVYGKKTIESERPFKAILQNGIWVEDGTLYCQDGKPQSAKSPRCFGGAAEVKIAESDGHIISMIHYK